MMREITITWATLCAIVARATRDVPLNEGADEWMFISEAQKEEDIARADRWLKDTFSGEPFVRGS
jgi:hypothetical protein